MAAGRRVRRVLLLGNFRAIKKLVGSTLPNGETEKGWAHYEFGWIGGKDEATGHPGNCAACIKHYKRTAGPESLFAKAAKAAGLKHAKTVSQPTSIPKITGKMSLNVLQKSEEGPPCHECPKAKLFPSNIGCRGLHPANELPVKLYYQARRPERFGTMDGGYLSYTMRPVDAVAILNEYADHFPHAVARQQCLELMTAIDQIATEVQSEREENMRQAARDRAKTNHKSG